MQSTLVVWSPKPWHKVSLDWRITWQYKTNRKTKPPNSLLSKMTRPTVLQKRVKLLPLTIINNVKIKSHWDHWELQFKCRYSFCVWSKCLQFQIEGQKQPLSDTRDQSFLQQGWQSISESDWAVIISNRWAMLEKIKLNGAWMAYRNWSILFRSW